MHIGKGGVDAMDAAGVITVRMRQYDEVWFCVKKITMLMWVDNYTVLTDKNPNTCLVCFDGVLISVCKLRRGTRVLL
jgi:hypothetical protein